MIRLIERKHLSAATLLLGCLLLASCFKDEPLNTECDILEAAVHVAQPETLFFSASDTLVSVTSSDQSVIFTVRSAAGVGRMAPTFRTTEGATISPASGSEHDFSVGGVVYTVTSQDGQWQRQYRVMFREADIPSHFDFEHYTLGPADRPSFNVWYELLPDGSPNLNVWGTGNAGYNYSRSTAQPDEYPSVAVADGYSGACVRLTTCDTGPFGRMANMRLAAGNLFLGKFNADVALRDAMRATEMGLPFTREPLHLSGYYKYQPGATFQDRQGNTVAGRTDQADVYSVLYRNHDAQGNAVTLYGDDVLTSPLIVRLARVATLPPTDSWTRFDADYQELGPLDAALLESRGYSLALVFTSSIDGATFQGAVGSTLYIDQVNIECRTQE